MFNATTTRVPDSTSDEVNQRIRRETKALIARCRDVGPDGISRRLAELDREWDVERAIEAEAATTILAGLLLGNTISRKLLLIPAFAGSMVLLHNLHGWYPLLPLFRRRGLRTQREIDDERCALKALRGDFRDVDGEGGDEARARRALEAARR